MRIVWGGETLGGGHHVEAGARNTNPCVGPAARWAAKIIDVLDREDPEDAVEIIPIRHSKAGALMEPLKALLSKRIEKFVTDQKGKQVKVTEESMTGLNISFDDRTNAIIAKGVQSRIDKLKEAILLLDVPTSAGARMVHSFSLLRLAPQDALGKLRELFAKLPEPERPTLLGPGRGRQGHARGHAAGDCTQSRSRTNDAAERSTVLATPSCLDKLDMAKEV